MGWGYSSVVIYDPNTKITIAIMMNRDLNGGSPGIALMNTAIQNIPVGIKPISNAIPEKFSLYQNFPNPFNPVTNIKFELPEKRLVTLSVINVLGQEVAVLHKGLLEAGTHV